MISALPIKRERWLAYPFGWLDQVVEAVLNPESDESTEIRENREVLTAARLREEFGLIWKLLKQQRFGMLFKKRQETLVIYYYEYLLKTRVQLRLGCSVLNTGDSKLAAGTMVLEALDELLRKLMDWYGPVLAERPQKGRDKEPVKPSFKILCRLSVDQVAILLKAADEIRLLTSRSFSLVLRTVVPFLSTERLRDFSWKSARSSTYKMEGTDKEVAIRVLEALIEKIREY